MVITGNITCPGEIWRINLIFGKTYFWEREIIGNANSDSLSNNNQIE